MQRLSLLSACIFAIFLASCGGSEGGGGAIGTTDTDSDGVPDSKDLCKNSLEENFISSSTTDDDKDGCEDSTEDQDGGDGSDEDNDGIYGDDPATRTERDKCEDGDKGWTSISTSTDPAVTITDYDSDGCRDAGEDTDDDNDGVPDVDTGGDATKDDKCPQGSLFTSMSTGDNINDYDGDGCKDDDPNGEDKDDDNDGVPDVDPGGDATKDDGCPKGKLFTSISTGDNINDFDGDGCRDSDEDDDDDNDTILDVTDVDDDNDGLIDIATAEELNNIRRNLAGTHYNDGSNSSNAGCPSTDCRGYELAQDIRLADLTGSDTKNWDPVGSNADPFTATLEGNDNTISNLIIVSDTPNMGFFAVLDGTVQNLSFVEGSVTSTRRSIASTPSRIGVLVGRNNGTISGVSTGISVVAGSGSNNYVGGLVGVNEAGTIQNSSATGNVSVGNGNGDYVGGLVGENYGGTIQNSYATGTANGGAGNDYVGGLVGSVGDSGTIQNSYATGTANGGAGDDNVGGLVGYNGTVGNSYATGTANGGADDDNVGGLMGYADNEYASVTLGTSYSLGDVNGGEGTDEVGRLLGKKGTGTGALTIASNYYNSESQLNNGETIEELTGTNEAKGRTKSQLKAINLDLPNNLAACEAAGGTWNDTASSCTDGNLAGWNAFNWEFQAGFHPTLKSYKTTTDTSTPSVITQIAGKLLCKQPTDFVQCTSNP